ncbi:MAG: cytochrome c [Pseudomonadota bacterium]
MRHLILALVCLLLGATAVAHEGVKNPAVMKRMHEMKAIGTDLKALAQMAKGAEPFDQTAAQAAAAAIAARAATVPKLFEAQEDDPKSEALPIIWDEFAAFTEKSKDMESAALRMSSSVTTLDELRPALLELGATCTACHRPYRE